MMASASPTVVWAGVLSRINVGDVVEPDSVAMRTKAFMAPRAIPRAMAEINDQLMVVTKRGL